MLQMPRKYQQKLGSRNYKISSSEDNLAKAIKDIETDRSSMLGASNKFKI